MPPALYSAVVDLLKASLTLLLGLFLVATTLLAAAFLLANTFCEAIFFSGDLVILDSLNAIPKVGDAGI